MRCGVSAAESSRTTTAASVVVVGISSMSIVARAPSVTQTPERTNGVNPTSRALTVYGPPSGSCANW